MRPPEDGRRKWTPSRLANLLKGVISETELTGLDRFDPSKWTTVVPDEYLTQLKPETIKIVFIRTTKRGSNAVTQDLKGVSHLITVDEIKLACRKKWRQ